MILRFLITLKQLWVTLKDSKLSLYGYATVSIVESIIGAILPILSAQIILNITSGLMKQLFYSAIAVFIIEFILYIMFYKKNLLKKF